MRPLSRYDTLQSAPQTRRLRRLPHVVLACLRLVWEASRSACIWAAVLQVVAGLAVGAELLAGNAFLSSLLDAVERDQGLGAILPELALVAGVGVVLATASALQAEQQRFVAELVTRHVEERLLRVASSVDLEAFETPAFYDRLVRAQVAGQSRPWQMTVGLLTLVTSVFTIVGAGVALATIQPLLVPLVVVASVPLWFATIRNSRSAHEFAYGTTTIDRERRYLAQVLMGRDFAKEVRVFDLVPPLRAAYDELYDRRMDELRALVRTRLRRLVPAGLIAAGLTGATLVVLAALVLDERMDLAGAAIAAIGVQLLATRLRTSYGSIGHLYEGALFLDDYTSFVALRPEGDGERAPAVDGSAPAGPPAVDGSAPAGPSAVDGSALPGPPAPAAPALPAFRTLAVEHVSFAYPGSGDLAVRDLSCHIDAGEIVALVGRNGSGKTTLAKLLAALYRPTSGRILWDGTDLATCDAVTVRRSLSVLFQDFGQYHLSAHDNIAVGRHEHRDDVERVRRAADDARAHEFVTRLERGYDTRLGRQFEGGRELSIGQWQRMAMARAFFRDAPFVVLDEPTAALDARAEHEVFERMRALARGKSVLLISHRFSSVRSADRIYVLDEGSIVEEGGHHDLMAHDGLYAQMFRTQASAYVDLEPRPLA